MEWKTMSEISQESTGAMNGDLYSAKAARNLAVCAWMMR